MERDLFTQKGGRASTKASESYPPLAKSAEATSFNTSRVEAQVMHSSTRKLCGLLQRGVNS
jgi:hypothetical protein